MNITIVACVLVGLFMGIGFSVGQLIVKGICFWLYGDTKHDRICFHLKLLETTVKQCLQQTSSNQIPSLTNPKK